jgi:hypothetical protein
MEDRAELLFGPRILSAKSQICEFVQVDFVIVQLSGVAIALFGVAIAIRPNAAAYYIAVDHGREGRLLPGPLRIAQERDKADPIGGLRRGQAA